MNLRFRLLGPLEVVVGGEVVPVGGPRAGAILSVLLVEAGGVVSRDRLIDEVWADDPPVTAVTALQVHVSGLRKLVGAALRTHGTGYALHVAPEQVDAAAFEALLNEAGQVDDPASRARLVRTALALWRGEPFTGVPQVPSVAAAVARLSELRLRAIEERVDADLALGRHEELTAELTELSLANRCRERLAGQLMLALHRGGRSADAIAAFARVRQDLREELGVGPGAELVALEQAIRRDDPTLAAPPPVSLPSPPGRFIGRERELAETTGLLGRTHLLTLVGPGGCGKTRLALELTRRTLPDHPDGAQFVDLAPLEPVGSVAAAVLAAMGVRPRHGAPPVEALASHLRGRRLLLLLDNCERVAEPCAELVGSLLELCPTLRVLVTSRQPLGLAGEVVWRVPGLAMPSGEASVDAAASTDAVKLLADRAAAAVPGHGLQATDAALAAAVCRRVDGLPLAIELVAARLASTSLSEIASNLDRRLSLLTTTGPGRTPRHRTMRAAIAWSHALLDDEERALFRRLSVFVGTFELAAAEEVGGDPDGDPPGRPDHVMPTLFQLIDKSMVAPVSAFAGRTRYRLLDTVREFAAEQLADPGEAERTRQRHAGWCRSLVRSVTDPAYTYTEYWPTRVDAEMGNLRAAVEWCLHGGRVELAMSMIAPLWPYFWYRGTADQGREWLLSCLAAVDATPTPVRGLALRAAAHLTRHSGDLTEARRLGEECLANYRALDDPDGVPAALNGLGITAYANGDCERALDYMQQALEAVARTNNPIAQAATYTNIGGVLRCLDRFGEAQVMLRTGLEVAREAGDVRTQADALNHLGMLALRTGDLEQGRRWARDSLAVYNTVLRFAEGQLDALETLAAIEAADGHGAEALQMLTVVARERQRLGGAALNVERRQLREDALAAARAALSEEEQAAAVAAARLVGREDLVADIG